MTKIIGAILCGGYGTRFTLDIPKMLGKIKPEITILEKQILDFKNAGINEVYLLTGNGHDEIFKKIGNKYKGVKIYYSKDEPKPLGTLGSIYYFVTKNNINFDAVLKNGDIVTDMNLKKFIEDSQKRNDIKMNMFLTPLRTRYGLAKFDGEYIIEFVEKPKLNEYINGGVYYLKKDVIDLIREKGKVGGDIEINLFPLIAKEKMMGFYKEDDAFWRSVETVKDLKEVQKFF